MWVAQLKFLLSQITRMSVNFPDLALFESQFYGEIFDVRQTTVLFENVTPVNSRTTDSMKTNFGAGMCCHSSLSKT